MLQSNEYFDGKVKSIGFTSSSTGRASVGVMAEGEYTFGTAQPEEMTVVSGALNVLLPGETEWKVYAAGEVFNVPSPVIKIKSASKRWAKSSRSISSFWSRSSSQNLRRLIDASSQITN